MQCSFTFKFPIYQLNTVYASEKHEIEMFRLGCFNMEMASKNFVYQKTLWKSYREMLSWAGTTKEL